MFPQTIISGDLGYILIDAAFSAKSRFRKKIIVVRFLALVTTMVTMVDHGNHRSNDRGNDRSNHRGYYDRYYNVNA